MAAFKDLSGAKPGATITLTKERKDREAKAAIKAIEKAKPRSTFSLFGLGMSDLDDKATPKKEPVKPAPAKKAPAKTGFFQAQKKAPPKKVEPAKKAPAKQGFFQAAPQKKAPPKKVAPAPKAKAAPKGVPTLNGWQMNRDGSVSGKISGAPSFRDGEAVTTSMIVNGRIESGEVVTTGSGSKYFLA